MYFYNVRILFCKRWGFHNAVNVCMSGSTSGGPEDDSIRVQTCSPNAIIYHKNTIKILGTAVAQWLRCCATNRKVAGSIPDGVIGIIHFHNHFRSHYGPGVYSASNRNEYQEYFLGVKASGA